MLSPVSHLYPSEFPVSWTRFNSALKTVYGWLPTSSQQTWELLYHLFNEFSFSCSLALLYCTCFDYNFFLMGHVLCLWIVSLKPGGSQINSKCFLGFSSLGKALVIWVADKNEIISINVFRQIETKLTCLTCILSFHTLWFLLVFMLILQRVLRCMYGGHFINDNLFDKWFLCELSS